MNVASDEIIPLDQDNVNLLTAVGSQMAAEASNDGLCRDLKNSVKVLEEKHDMIKFFTYSMAHDLKSPAIGIYGLTRLLQQKYGEQLDERGQRYCRQILRTSKQMMLLVENLNSFIDAKEAPMNFEKITIREIAQGIKKEYSSRLKEQGVRWPKAVNLPKIVADRMAVSRVFRNFVDNALKYGGEDLKTIRISYEETSDFHVFSFSDDGAGIEEKDREEIFDRFQRKGNARGIAGSGLGLAIVREVAKRHKGSVWIDPETTCGATFHMTISKDLDVVH